VALWTSRYNGPANGNDLPSFKSCLAIGPDGSVYITGRSDGDYTANSSYDFATVKYVSVPDLSIALTSTNMAMISWSLTPTGFDLQQNTNLNTTNWIPPPETTSSNGTHKFIIANPPTGNRFFRLFHP